MEAVTNIACLIVGGLYVLASIVGLLFWVPSMHKIQQLYKVKKKR